MAEESAGANIDLLKAQRRIFESSLRPLERLVGLALLDHWSRRCATFPSVERLSRWTGLGRSAVMRALAGLDRAGAILRHGRNGTKTTYDLRPIMSLPVSEGNRSSGETGLSETPNQSLSETATGLSGRPEGTQIRNPGKEPTAARATHGSPTKGAKKAKRTKKPEGPIPPDWRPTEAHRDFATKHVLDVELEAVAFRGHFEGKTVASANGRFSTWLANAAKWKRERGGSMRRGVQPSHGATGWESAIQPSHGANPWERAEQAELKEPEGVSSGSAESPTEASNTAPKVSALALAERAALWLSSPKKGAEATPHPDTWPEFLRLEELRASLFGVTPNQLRRGDFRVRRLLERCAEGYSEDALGKAIRGSARDDYYRAKPQMQGLDVILGDAARVDRFIALADAPLGATPPRSRLGPVQTSHGTGFEAFDQAQGNR